MSEPKIDRNDGDASLIAVLCNFVSRIDDVTIDMFDPLASFDQMGLDSIAMLVVANSLEERLGVELPTHLMWDCPDFPSLAAHLRAIVPDPRLQEFVSSETLALSDPS